MTVSAVPGHTPFLAGNGNTNVWSFSFSVSDASDLAVLRIAENGGASVIDPSFYTVQLSEGGANGGNVVYPTNTDRVPAGESIFIKLSPPETQPTRLRDEGHYNPNTVERALDHIVRQVKHLRSDLGGYVPAPVGAAISFGPPVDGSPLYWRKLDDGSFQIHSGSEDETASGTPPELRILYANDLGLKGDGTDEIALLNAKILELSEAGRPTIIHLQSGAGYWPLGSQLKLRSGVSLSCGSPFRATPDGSIGLVGNYARLTTAATMRSTASVGSTTLPVETVAGGAISASYAIGDQVEFTPSSMLRRITAIDDGNQTITVTPETDEALIAGDGVRKLVFSYCAASWTRHDTPNELAVADSSLFALGDLVSIEDDEIATHTDGIQTFRLNRELATITGFGAGTIKLDRSIKHWMTTGNYARVIKLNPCRNATLSGATVEFVGAPDADRVDTFQISKAYRCQLLNCSVPNEDDFGTRGRSFNFDLSYQCDLLDCWTGPAKYTAAGEGYGCAFVHSTDCSVSRFRSLGPRHAVSFIASTDCVARNTSAAGWEINCIDWHGLREIGCWAYETNGTGTQRPGQCGIAMGNTTWLAGCFECGADGGEITDLQGSEARAIRICTPTDDVDVQNMTFRRVSWGVYAENVDGYTDVEAGEVRISCEFHRADKCVRADMNRYGGTAKPFNKLDLTGSKFYHWVDGIEVDNCDDVVADVYMYSLRAGVDTYAVDVVNCSNALVSGHFECCRKHFHFENATFSVENYTIRGPVTTALIDETSSVAVEGGGRDAWGRYPKDWVPVRTSPETEIELLLLPGMS